jgi:hypothetical protein
MKQTKTTASRGRAKGQVSKKCLISDPLLDKWEIHIDEGSHTFMVVNKETQMNEGYYTTVGHALKSIAKRQIVPTAGPVTVSEYYALMSAIETRLLEFVHSV